MRFRLGLWVGLGLSLALRGTGEGRRSDIAGDGEEGGNVVGGGAADGVVALVAEPDLRGADGAGFPGSLLGDGGGAVGAVGVVADGVGLVEGGGGGVGALGEDVGGAAETGLAVGPLSAVGEGAGYWDREAVDLRKV